MKTQSIIQAILAARAEIDLREPVEARGELHDGINYAICFIGSALKSENEFFDYASFLKACGAIQGAG